MFHGQYNLIIPRRQTAFTVSGLVYINKFKDEHLLQDAFCVPQMTLVSIYFFR